ncbi:DEAD/DEAH box helicase [bacterium]|nr:DEAD/DEAH box helicase [bacterium]
MKTFAELPLLASVQRALTEEQYVTPTPIQAQTIPAAMEGRDILGCAQTGTGKTAAFALPILHQLGQSKRRAQPNQPYALILAPTRELAIQITDSLSTYGRHLPLRHVTVYGGVGQFKQVQGMNRGAHILVATPGRLLDLIGQGHIELDALEMFVLDEVDRMLDMGFLPDLKRIISMIPEDRQSLFFSATLPPNIVELARQLLRNPVSVHVEPESKSIDRIEQKMLFVERRGKRDLLYDILCDQSVERAVVFTKTKFGANQVAEFLDSNGIPAAAIHGNKSQGARQRALDAFRRQLVRVLVATDVAARGIDIDGVTHVINFDLPIEPEAYVHRIGRTGRAGASGIAISFCSPEERRELRAIERLLGMRLAANAPAPQRPRLERPQTDRPRPERSEAMATATATAGRPRGPKRPQTARPPHNEQQQRPPRKPQRPMRPRRADDRPPQEQMAVDRAASGAVPPKPPRGPRPNRGPGPRKPRRQTAES